MDDTEWIAVAQDRVGALAESERSFVRQLIDDWIAATEYASSISVIVRHPSFSLLLNHKQESVRIVLQNIQAGIIYYHWFPLLKKCTGVDPVPAHDRGFTTKMAEHWVRWGKEGGKI